MAVDLTEIAYVKRFVVGSSNPEKLHDEAEIERQMQALNEALTSYPKGKIIACERSFALLSINEHQIVLQWVVYHVGFTRKPAEVRE
ncbi:MAG: hypothetical protein IAB19_01625 [Proteobacteria bacterium]|uniref:Uncharacterized protein n=1 Tax=Candidatus Avisuccinivibrio stercorigallinarum TaxID=2840704 RepID=A0A9D9DAQ5_9GAMM|nr:hypothetical protein [Candidatus Avisuccinivibrio stercorigallinarum]